MAISVINWASLPVFAVTNTDVYESYLFDIGVNAKAILVLVGSAEKAGASRSQPAQVLVAGRPALCRLRLDKTTGLGANQHIFMVDSEEIVQRGLTGPTLIEVWRTASGNAGTSCQIQVWTADDWIAYQAIATSTGTSTNPSITVAASGLNIQAIGLVTTEQQTASGIAPQAGTTTTNETNIPYPFGIDYCNSFNYKTTQGTGSDQTMSWTSASKSRALSAIGIKEVAAWASSPIVDFYVGRTTAKSTTASFASLVNNSQVATTIAAGDYCFVQAACVSASGTPVRPTIPSGWIEINSGDTPSSSGARAGMVIAYKVLTGAETDIGTWTNATDIAAYVYRFTGYTATVGSATAATSTTSTGGGIDIPALTPDVAGTSHVLFFGMSAVATNSHQMFHRTLPTAGSRNWIRTLSAAQSANQFCFGDSGQATATWDAFALRSGGLTDPAGNTRGVSLEILLTAIEEGSGSSVNFVITKATPFASNYDVYVSTQPIDSVDDLEPNQVLSGNAAGFTVSDLTEGATYYVRIVAIRNGVTAASTQVIVNT